MQSGLDDEGHPEGGQSADGNIALVGDAADGLTLAGRDGLVAHVGRVADDGVEALLRRVGKEVASRDGGFKAALCQALFGDADAGSVDLIPRQVRFELC